MNVPYGFGLNPYGGSLLVYQKQWQGGHVLLRLCLSEQSKTVNVKYYSGIQIPNMLGIQMVQTHPVEEWFGFQKSSEYQTIIFGIQMIFTGFSDITI